MFEGVFRVGFGFRGGLDGGPEPWFWGITYGGIGGIIVLIRVAAISSGMGSEVVSIEDAIGVVSVSISDNVIFHSIGLGGIVVTIGISAVNSASGDVWPILAR